MGIGLQGQSMEEITLVLIVTVVFKEDLKTQHITATIERIRNQIKTHSNLVQFVIIQPRALPI